MFENKWRKYAIACVVLMADMSSGAQTDSELKQRKLLRGDGINKEVCKSSQIIAIFVGLVKELKWFDFSFPLN